MIRGDLAARSPDIPTYGERAVLAPIPTAASHAGLRYPRPVGESLRRKRRFKIAPILEARAIQKSYGHVHALRGADCVINYGEVTALIGDNGAGKSTLVKILSGVLRPDEGNVLVDGASLRFSSPADAHSRGIETVYQDLALAPDLGPAANLFLGREIRRKGMLGKLGVLDNQAMRRRTAEAFESLGVAVDPTTASVSQLSGGQRQGVAVARAVTWASKVVFMDEPTAALGVMQSERVVDLIRRVADSGVAVLLISHNMPEVLEVADRIVVLRLGQSVAEIPRAEATMEVLVGAMTGALTFNGSQAGADGSALADG